MHGCVYGTNPISPDSDGDGVKDGAEVDAGTDPLDGLPARTGIINTVRTPAPALDVCAINDVAIVAQGNGGVSVVNVVNGQNPVIIAQVDTPGFAQSVTCSGNLIAVADGAAGLAIIDLTDPPAARIVRQLNLGSAANTVASGGGIAYVGLASGQLVAIDMPMGTILATIGAGGAIHVLGLAGDSLFVLRSDQLRAYRLTGGFLDFEGSVSVSGFPAEGITGRKRLFVGSRIAYTTSYLGYETIDVGDPRNMRHIASAQDIGPNSFKQIVDNGSGLGVAAVGVNPRDDGTHDVSLYDVSNPTNTTRFLTQFPTPGLARALSIYNGLAYVADGDAGLQVVNYRAYDAQGIPPTISLTTSFAPGIAEEGKLIRITALVSDDVQVRKVEFYVEGVRVLTDGNFPFEHRFITPLKTGTKTNFTIQAKATDTGGNFTWTSNLVVNLVPDATPPRVVRTSPANGELFAQTPIVVYWNESVDPSTLGTNAFILFLAGPDSVPGTADDVPVSGGVIQYREDIAALSMNFSVPLTGGIYRVVVRPPLTDLFGNALVTTNEWSFQVPVQIAYGQTVGRTISTTVPRHSYAFTAQSGDLVRLWANDGNSGNNFNPTVELFDAGGRRLGSVSHSYSAFLQLAVTNAGTYFVLVSDDNGAQGGAYALNLQRLNPPGNTPLLTYGQSTNGSISVFGQWNAYQFVAQAGDLVRVRANDANNVNNFNPTIELFDATGTRLRVVSASYDANLETTLTNGGIYFVLISDDDGAQGGVYDLNLQRLNPPGGTVALSYGQTAGGSISRFGQWNAFQFTAQTGDLVRLWANDANSGNNFNPTVELFDAGGRRLGSVSHSYSAFLQLAVTNAGTYFVLVSDDDGAQGGAYALNLQRLNPPGNAPLLTYGQSTNGSISVFGQWNAYQFVAQAGDLVRVRANDANSGNNFNPTIELFDATGTRLSSASHSFDSLLMITFTNAGIYSFLVSDDDGAQGASYILALLRWNDLFIPTASVWNYLDNGSDQGTNWVKTNFIDTSWVSGPTQLGYGDGDESTIVSFGPDPNNKPITTYFRRTFSATNASSYTNLMLRLMRDDGAAVYLNGVEVFRSNLPAGLIAFTTLASTDISGMAENTFLTASVNSNLLLNGPNVLAVEIHQSAADSDDLSFDLELIGIRTP